MDETHRSRTLDAAAIRKRRSSILKNQRAPRTPLSELEFNVATPTETAKSRRVSFSRRTGVAEFITNEATTTWKNFYEEHNKSLESSANDSEINAHRQRIDHIGKRILDEQFEEVEVVEFIDNNPPGLNVNTSINFTQQLASLECTGDDRKLSAPVAKFELSTFTDQQSKIFGDELRTHSLCEMSGGINVNFSAVQTIQVRDDLDEIQRDLERVHTNDSHKPFIDNANVSDYIEIDLNTTRIRDADIDMTVTDTIPSSKVDVSKNCYVDNKLNLSQDWIADKENIVIDPYAAPRESDNFAINKESDKVLVFDGKRLTLQSERDNVQSYRQTLLPNVLVDPAPKRKTIVLNTNDDLPNFIDDIQISKNEVSRSIEQEKSVCHLDFDMSTTRAVVSNLIIPGESIIRNVEKTVVYGDNAGNISITQALPAIIVCNENSQKRKTIFYDPDTADISVTKAVGSNIMLVNKTDLIVEKSNNTAFAEAEYGDMSITQALPANIIVDKVLEKGKTIIYESGTEDISMTRALSVHILADGNITDDENCAPEISVKHKSISVTNEYNSKDIAIHETSNVNLCQKELLPLNTKTIVPEINNGNSSLTQSTSINKILPENKLNNKSKCDDFAASNIINSNNLYEADDINISHSIVYEKHADNTDKISQVARNIEGSDLTNVNQIKKRHTIVFENNEADISMTCAIPSNIVLTGNLEIASNKGQPIVFDDNCDVSMTETIPCNLLLENNEIRNNINTLEQSEAKQKSIVLDNIDITGKEQSYDKMDAANEIQAIAFENDVDMSITESNGQIPNRENITLNSSDRIKTNDLSVTKSYPPKSVSLQIEPVNMEQQNIFYEEKYLIHSKQDILVYQAETAHSHSTSKLKSKKTDEGELKYFTTLDSKSHSKGQIMDLITDVVFNDVNEIKMSQVSENKNDNQNISNNEEVIKREILDMALSSTLTSDHNIINKENENIAEANKSILDDLLDMSTISMVGSVEDKDVMVKIQSDQQLVDNKQICDENKVSNESMFYIMKDSDEEVQTENLDFLSSKKEIDSNNRNNRMPQLKDNSLLKLEYVEDNPPVVDNIEKKLGDLKCILQDKKSQPKNRHYEKILSSSDLDSEMIHLEKSNRTINVSNVRKSIRNADDTNDLLQLLSDYTENKASDYIEEDEANNEPVKVDGLIALQNKSKITDPKRISCIPSRRSVSSKAKLLNNLSQLQAELHKSKFDLENDNFEDFEMESPEKLRKSVRISKEVVKALEFEDDTDSETSTKSDILSPLKKTAFGETSYMKETKTKVIPNYLKEIPNEIKELMHDLVKPTADTMPIDNPKLVKNLNNVPSTCSTQIQANLTTSSQIDVCTELYSNPASTYDIGKQKLADDGADLGNQVNTHEPKRSIKTVTINTSDKSLEIESVDMSCVKEKAYRKSPKQEQSIPERVLVFDHYNPLNNVLLAPLNQYEAHKYNPVQSSDTLNGSERSASVQISVNEKASEVEPVSIQYNIENHLALTHLTRPFGDACIDKNVDTQSIVSNLTKRTSVDQSIDTKMTEVKDRDVNTVIIMKGNKELLEASSSLTLVDDALTRSVFDVDIGSKDEMHKVDTPVKNIYQTETHASVIEEKMDTDIISCDSEPEHIEKHCKAKKRSYSPAKRDRQKQPLSNVEITPKPLTKMQKISNSPNITRTAIDVSPQQAYKFYKDRRSCTEEKHTANETNTKDDSVKINNTFDGNKKRSPRKSLAIKTNTTITVQQMTTEYNIAGNELKEKVIQVLNEPKSITSTVEPKTQSDVEDVKSLDIISSFTSSKNQNEAHGNRSLSLECQQTSGSSVRSGGCISWHPELVNELSSKNLISECESSANVVAKIDMLPFMGSRECEWETCMGDTWSFLLVHARVRLSVRLAHRHGSAVRSYVRADTPVDQLTVEIVKHDKGNCVASACVGFAAEAMRYLCTRERESGRGLDEGRKQECEWGRGCDEGSKRERERGHECDGGRGCKCAGDVPALVRQCAAVARLAVQWGRAMHEARLRLAYTLTDDGLFSLKFIGLPLWLQIHYMLSDDVAQAGEHDKAVERLTLKCNCRNTPIGIRRQIFNLRVVAGQKALPPNHGFITMFSFTDSSSSLQGFELTSFDAASIHATTELSSLQLQVANVPLRSVWEVRMRLELTVQDAQEAPWPRACDVRVTSVLSDYPVSEKAVRRTLANIPHDWGHVPRTVWYDFFYPSNPY